MAQRKDPNEGHVPVGGVQQVELRYVGPYDEVAIPLLGIIVQRGKTFPVDHIQADALVQQTDFQPAEDDYDVHPADPTPDTDQPEN